MKVVDRKGFPGLFKWYQFAVTSPSRKYAVPITAQTERL